MAYRSNKINLDTNLKEWHPVNKKFQIGARIGIEIELEGKVSPINMTSYWCTKPDGSLKNGIEFVMNEPVPMALLPTALESFKASLALYKMKPETSIRTSTHIHVNVLEYSFRQVYHAVCAYYLLEEILVGTQGKDRIGNLFCLRMKDSNAIPWLIRDALDSGPDQTFREDFAKYGALNLCTLLKYGSLEFRFLEAYTDTKKLEFWSRVLDELVTEGSKYHPTKLLAEYDALPVRTFIHKLLPETGRELLLLSPAKTSDALNSALHTNYDSLKSIARWLDRSDDYQCPRVYWTDDYDAEQYSSPYDALYAPMFAQDDTWTLTVNTGAQIPAATWFTDDDIPIDTTEF